MHENRADARQHDFQTKIFLSAIFKVNPSSVICHPSSVIEAQILFNRVNKAQLLTYLKLSGLNLGLILNFNVSIMRDGIVRIVNELPE